MNIKLIHVVKIYISLFGYKFPKKQRVKCAITTTRGMIVLFNKGRQDAKKGENDILSLYEIYGNPFPDYPEVTAKLWGMFRESYFKGREAITQ